LTKRFPIEERYSMVDQIRRPSRSVCANLAEGWRKPRYPNHFVSKITDSASEAEETRVWLELASRCGYISQSDFEQLDRAYDIIIAQLVNIESNPNQWTIH
jgi:four helix bundle protein